MAGSLKTIVAPEHTFAGPAITAGEGLIVIVAVAVALPHGPVTV